MNAGATTPWDRGEAERAAIALFGNAALHRAAAAMASAHPRALDYIRQAPVIVLAATAGQTGCRAARSAQAYAGPPMRMKCERGDKLRDVMAFYGCGYQLRRLAPSVLHPVRWPTVHKLGGLLPSTLAQIVPDKRSQQDVWLRALTRWTESCRHRCANPWFRFEWAAVALREVARGEERRVSDIADMVIEAAAAVPRADAVFDPRWSLAQARAALERWHRALGRMREESEVATLLGIGFADPIDYAPFSNEPVAIAGLTFVPLRSCEDLWVEGAAMHHCVATYSTSVYYGMSRVFSIQQAGRRIATAEWAHDLKGPPDALSHFRLRQLTGPCNTKLPKAVLEAARAFKASLRDEAQRPEGLRAAFPDVGGTFSGERAA